MPIGSVIDKQILTGRIQLIRLATACLFATQNPIFENVQN